MSRLLQSISISFAVVNVKNLITKVTKKTLSNATITERSNVAFVIVIKAFLDQHVNVRAFLIAIQASIRAIVMHGV